MYIRSAWVCIEMYTFYPLYYITLHCAHDMVECHFQIHKTHVDWLGKVLCTQDPAKGVELVHCSTSRKKIALFLLNLRFNIWQILLSSTPEKIWGGWRVRFPLCFPFLKSGPPPLSANLEGLPLKSMWCCRCVSTRTAQSLEFLQADLIHPRALLFSHLNNFSPGDRRILPKSPDSASSLGGMLVGFRRSSKYSFHRPIISGLDVSSWHCTASHSWDIGWWTTIFSKLSRSHSSWPHQTPFTPEILPQWPPKPHSTRPAGTCQLPSDSYQKGLIR